MRKTGKEIGFRVAKGTIDADETFEWLSSATAQEIQEYIRGVGSLAPTWSAFGRDALNVLLANENIKLQTDIRDMTDKMKKMTTVITILTVVIVILTFIQAYPIIKTFFYCSEPSVNIQQTEKAINQQTETNQIKAKNNDSLGRTKTINHKETPNK